MSFRKTNSLFQKKCQGNVIQNQKKATALQKSSRQTKKESISEECSNNLNDACKVQCQLCDKILQLSMISHHTFYIHRLDLTKYKNIYGDPKESLIKKTLHECGLCHEVLLLDLREIDGHLKRRKHNMSHKEYATIFLNDKQNSRSTKNQEESRSSNKTKKKKQEQVDLYNLTANELMALLDNVLKE